MAARFTTPARRPCNRLLRCPPAPPDRPGRGSRAIRLATDCCKGHAGITLSSPSRHKDGTHTAQTQHRHGTARRRPSLDAALGSSDCLASRRSDRRARRAGSRDRRALAPLAYPCHRAAPSPAELPADARARASLAAHPGNTRCDRPRRRRPVQDPLSPGGSGGRGTPSPGPRGCASHGRGRTALATARLSGVSAARSLQQSVASTSCALVQRGRYARLPHESPA